MEEWALRRYDFEFHMESGRDKNRWNDRKALRFNKIMQFMGKQKHLGENPTILPSKKEVHPFHLINTKLIALLQAALKGPMLSFTQVTGVGERGLYIIFRGPVIIYVGKTERSGKQRMRELAADFRSHTLNRKLLIERLKDQGLIFAALNSKTKDQWIRDAVLSKDEFRMHQDSINNVVRTQLTFKFFPVPGEKELGQLEHFAIAVLEPLYND